MLPEATREGLRGLGASGRPDAFRYVSGKPKQTGSLPSSKSQNRP
jgi:hypothetical protein